MTDRIHGVVVVLDKDIRIDDAEDSVLLALQQIKGVVAVRPLTADVTNEVIRARFRHEMLEKIFAVFNDQ